MFHCRIVPQKYVIKNSHFIFWRSLRKCFFFQRSHVSLPKYSSENFIKKLMYHCRIVPQQFFFKYACFIAELCPKKILKNLLFMVGWSHLNCFYQKSRFIAENFLKKVMFQYRFVPQKIFFKYPCFKQNFKNLLFMAGWSHLNCFFFP